jgi:hypothetical protein
MNVRDNIRGTLHPREGTLVGLRMQLVMLTKRKITALQKVELLLFPGYVPTPKEI